MSDTIDCFRDCPLMGSCCKSMVLTMGGKNYPTATNIRDARQQLQEYGMPFDLIGFTRSWNEHDRDYRYSWRVGCVMVLPDGLCGIYDSRPNVCKIFKAGSDALCILHPEASQAREENVIYPLTDLLDGSFSSDILRKVYGKAIPLSEVIP